MEAVHRYEGTVNQVMGDGIMALFGAPLAHEDHAVRACYAALPMQESMQAVRRGDPADARRRGPDPRRPQLGRGRRPVDRQRSAHGLHGGGPDDPPGRADGAAGAARLDPADAPRRLQLAEGYVAGASRSGRCRSRGCASRSRSSSWSGSGRARTRLQAAAARGLTQVRRSRRRDGAAPPSARQAGAGQGQVVAIVGEPGVGKSRLVYEFTHSHRDAGLAGPGSRLRLLRQGHELSARSSTC